MPKSQNQTSRKIIYGCLILADFSRFNLLAGRAFTFNLYPLTSTELSNTFDLATYLRFGGLPYVWNVKTDKERILFLRSYVITYIKEEIAEEQIVRKLEPFAKFLQVAAQSSGYILNYTNLAKNVGVSDQTIKTYFQILEDTLLGFLLPAFNRSIRKAQGKSPKFYLFDIGVLRTLQRVVDQPFNVNHFNYGLIFEHFIIQEIKRIAEYKGYDFRYSYLRLPNGDEIDLIIERPGRALAVIEIKSTNKVVASHIEILKKYKTDFPQSEFYLLSKDIEPKEFSFIKCLHWKKGISEIIGDN